MKPCKRHNLIRSMDIAPTLLDMALGEEMHAQGVSLKSILHGGPEFDLIGIAERNATLKKRVLQIIHALEKTVGCCSLTIVNLLCFSTVKMVI